MMKTLNCYEEIKNNLIKSEIYDKTRDYSKDKNIIKHYSEKLVIDGGKNIMKEI